jgi:methylated-DNA-[protein]-cysteine S-methyltransferase
MTATSTAARAEQPATVLWEEVDSPLGAFLLAGDGRTLVQARLPGGWSRRDVPGEWVERDGGLGPAARQLAEYFAGTRLEFDLEYAPQGTAFQLAVWQALTTIPYGQTASYKRVATLVGNERATRAVGLANNRNPIALFVPCHRVIGSNGSLTGYGGGLEMKAWLLDHERRVAAGS